MPILTDQERCGTLLAERYTLESILGRGGMGVVFRAHDDGGGPVAVKILRPELASESQFAKRFVREAKAAASIHHPNVVEVLDLGVEPDGTIYQVLQLLEGQSLRDHLEVKGKLSVERTLEIMLPVLSALEAAHDRGIVHRDLKPDNIFLSRRPDGQIVPTLLDFGIAKVLEGSSSFATNTGSIMGTPAYMAPEQATGSKDQGPRIDVWAMGIIAFECLRGEPPFRGGSPANVMLKIMTERPPPVDQDDPSVPPSIARAVERALERDQTRRHETMRAFADALRAGAADAGLDVPEPGRTSTVTPLSLSPPSVKTQIAGSGTPDGISVAFDSKDLALDRPATQARDPGRHRGERAEAATEPASRARALAPAPSVAQPAASAPTPPAAAVALAPGRGIAVAGLAAIVVASLVLAYVAFGASPPPPSASAPIAAPPPSTVAALDPPATVAPPASAAVPPPSVATPPPDTSVVATPRARAHRPHGTTTSTAAAEAPPSSVERHDSDHTLPGVVEW